MSRWLDETGGNRGGAYDARFRALAASGADVHGEAAYVHALLTAGAAVLDAGCGTGRVAVELARRGHRVMGVDSDASMLDVARSHDEVTWVLQDLATLDRPERFDLAVAAGNVMVFLAAGTEQAVVDRLAAHLVPGGLLVSGWRTDRLSRATYDSWARAAGLEPVVRHATWQGQAWYDDADWCVAVDARP
jgi:2-polyprenyl-3-methyl-5-hydroxy-6-metoxy-1,4-benzoquinol methylase